MRDQKTREIFDALVEHKFQERIDQIRAYGLVVEILKFPFRATELTLPQAQVEIDGRIECWYWSYERNGWG